MIDWLKNEESGQGMVEYGLILVLVSIVAIMTLTTVGTTLKSKFKVVDDKLKTEPPVGGE